MQNSRFNPHTNLLHSHQNQRFPFQNPLNIPINGSSHDQLHTPEFQSPNLLINHPHHHHPSYGYSDYERRLRDEVIYLHSLWHRGPPRNPQQNPYLKPSISTQFKKKGKKNKTLISDKEWPVDSKPSCPSPPGSGWAEFKPVSAPKSWPATAEEQARVLAMKIQLKGLDSCIGLFHKPNNESDDDDDDDEDEDEEDEEEHFDFFSKVFEENNELRGYYEKNCVNGEFYCLVCGVIGSKLGRKYKNCLALVQHSIAISKTKKRMAHRAYGRVICKVLGWDINQLPSLEKSIELQGEVKNHADNGEDHPTVVEKEGDFASTSNGQAELKDIPDAIETNNVSSMGEGCIASELTHNESGRKDNHEGLEEDKLCSNAENIQSEQDDIPESVVKDIVNKIGEGSSAVVSESFDCGDQLVVIEGES